MIRLPPVIHQERFERLVESPAWQVTSAAQDPGQGIDGGPAGALGGGLRSAHSLSGRVAWMPRCWTEKV